MNDEILAAQRELVAEVEATGWDVTETELSVYESPWIDEDDPEATITITARKLFPTETSEDDNPYRVK